MNSKIIYLDNKEENTFKYNICKEIRDHLLNISNNKAMLSPTTYYDILLYSKYLIEKNNLDCFKIINGDIEELLSLLKESDLGKSVHRYAIASFKSKEIYKFLGKMVFEDYIIETYKDRILDNYIDEEKKYLLISSDSKNYVTYPNVDIYVEKNYNEVSNRFKIYDSIIGINRRYYSNIDEINYHEYDEIIFLNNDDYTYLDYSEFLNKYFKDSRLKFKKNIFMITNYYKISNYKNSNKNLFFKSLELNEIEKIMIDNDKAYLLYDRRNASFFDKDDKTIIIKELSNIQDIDLRKEISDNTNSNNNVVVTREDIKNNNYRIGFSAYNKKIDNKKILMLIDRNTSIVKRIRKLDDEITKQIDRMIIK